MIDEQTKLEVIREFMTRHTSSNADRMSIDDLHKEIEELSCTTYALQEQVDDLSKRLKAPVTETITWVNPDELMPKDDLTVLVKLAHTDRTGTLYTEINLGWRSGGQWRLQYFQNPADRRLLSWAYLPRGAWEIR